jgi:hypothetical protein
LVEGLPPDSHCATELQPLAALLVPAVAKMLPATTAVVKPPARWLVFNEPILG